MVKVKEVHFYADKVVSFLFFSFCLLVVFVWILTCKEEIDFKNNLVESIILCLLLPLFIYGIIYYFLLLIRIKPLLTITNQYIIIYRMFKSPSKINLDNVNSFFIVNGNHKGITTSREIYIELKEPSAYFRKYWINRLIGKFSNRLANSQYSIHTNVLKVKQKDLFKILNDILKTT